MKLISKKIVPFQGEHGAFSEIAVLNLFGKNIKTGPSYTFKDVFEKVKSEKYEYGVVPVENTLGGIVYQVWDLLNEYDLQIVAETKVKIEHCLIANPGTKIADINKIYAHYQAALQCENLLRKHPSWTVKDSYDTAGSVKIIKELPKEEKMGVAAIASYKAAEFYRMDILKKGVQDSKENYTRFIVISRKQSNLGNKFTCMLSLKHKHGSLLEILKTVERYRINLTSVHSRPNKNKPFEYNFFLEGICENKLDDFIKEIKLKSNKFKLLGTYNQNI